MPRSIKDHTYMSLLQSNATTHPACATMPSANVGRARRATVAATLAVTLATMLATLPAGPAHAQGGTGSPPGGPKPLSRTGSADPGMIEAENAASQKRYQDAIDRFDRVIAANPRNAQARFERAWAIAQAGRDDEAIQAFHEIAQDFPELPEPHNNLALLYARRGDLKRAEAELLLALEARPGYAIAYTNLGDVYRGLAEQAYAAALKRNPGDARAKAGLAQVRVASPKPAAKPAGKTGQTDDKPQDQRRQDDSASPASRTDGPNPSDVPPPRSLEPVRGMPSLD
jgi:hypothetical protein